MFSALVHRFKQISPRSVGESLQRWLLLCFLLSFAPLARADSACAPLGMSTAELRELSEAGFSQLSGKALRGFLEEVPVCLGSPDAFLRDTIGYAGTAAILRREATSDSASIADIRHLKAQLIEGLRRGESNTLGVFAPFAILVLAEVARTDRIDPWMTDEERQLLLGLSGDYLETLEDYRAFEDGVGFRHGVAHGADLVLQLALNPSILANELAPQAAAVGSKIAPLDSPAYTTGEPGRLARALFFMIQRSQGAAALAEAIEDVLATLADPAPYSDWSEVFSSEAGLRFRHNRRAFAEALYVRMAPHQDHELISPFWRSLDQALKAIP